MQSVYHACRKNYSLIPIVATIGFGLVLSSAYCIRTLTRSPDTIVLRNKTVPHDRFWKEDGTAVQYKFLSAADYSKLKKPDVPKLD
jgi:hypothetical protein